MSARLSDPFSASVDEFEAAALQAVGGAVTLTASTPSAALVEAATGIPGIATSSVSLALGGGFAQPHYLTTGWTALGGGFFSKAGSYGTAMMDTIHGGLTYTLNNALAATNALAGGQVAHDVFTVNASDGVMTASTPISFDITGTDDAPTARSDQTATPYNTPLVLASSVLVGNDSDPEGDALSITAVGAPQHGTVSLSGGHVTFTPFFGFVGFARFSYTIDDGHGGTSTAYVGVNVTSTTGNNGMGPPYVYVGGAASGQTVDVSGDGQPHLVIGSNFNDFIYGGGFADTLNGGGGADLINGGGGNDLISGGPGSDTLYGGAGADSFIWSRSDLLQSAQGAQDAVLDFEGAGDGRLSGDFLLFTGFSAGSGLAFKAQSNANPHLYYYTLTDHASGASELIAIGSVDGLPLSQGDYLFI